MSEESSHRHILRSTSIIGGASVLNILIGIVRTKAAAVLLGPSGIGLIGLLQALMSSASTFFSMGLGMAGTRQIAEAVGAGDPTAIALARRALFWGTLVLSAVGAGAFWLLRGVVAEIVMGGPSWATQLGWLAIAVFMTIAAGSQLAVLTGLRRTKDIAHVSVLSAVLSTIFGVGALLLWGTGGLLAFVLAVPLTAFFIGHVYVAKLPALSKTPVSALDLLAQWRTLIRVGGAFMVAGCAMVVGQLVVRGIVQRQLGAVALGQFQAAWTVSMTYVGFVLTSMGTDYYPRLTATIRDLGETNRLVNEQAEVALLLAGPLFLVMLGLAPWVIDLLYSDRFYDSIIILRWQVLGDILKVASFPLVYILLAAGAGRSYMLVEIGSMAVFVSLVWLGLPLFGIKLVGVAFFVMYFFYLSIVYWLARRATGFRWTRRVRSELAVIFVAATAIHAVSIWRTEATAVGGVMAGISFGAYSIRRLVDLTGSGVPAASRLQSVISTMRPK